MLNNQSPMMMKIQSIFKKQYILPAEHGSWIWWIGPLLIGASAARALKINMLWLSLAMLAAFLFRQPASMLVKSFSGRRPQTDRIPSLIWCVIYASLTLIAFTVLLCQGQLILLYLSIPGIPVFIWHLWLVRQRAERGQRGIEIVGAGVLSLAAPAAYWVNGGPNDRLAWILWGLTWLQSASSIVFVYLRLAQRKWEAKGSLRDRFEAGLRTLAYHLFNLALASAIYLIELIPLWIVIAFLTMLLDAFDGVLRPAVGFKPTRIGLRQLGMSSLFVLISVLAFALPAH
jgi:hypothetical protein